MKTIFARIFLSIIIALFIFIIIMLFIQIYGFKLSVNKWEDEKNKSLQESIKTILTELYSSGEVLESDIASKVQFILTGNIYVTIYDKDKTPIFVVRARGLRKREIRTETESITTLDMIPVFKNNSLEIYFTLHILNDRYDYENEKFFESLKFTYLTAIFVSFLIASFFALFFSRGLSNQSKKVSAGIDQIAHDNLNINIDERGIAEISSIARSANILKEKLKKEKALRDQWALDIAHDLRTPVTAIKTQLEGIIDKVFTLSDERSSRLLNELNKIEYLINGLQELITLESPEIKVAKKQINVNEFLFGIKNTFHDLINEKKIKFIIDNKLESISGDEKLLNRAFSNIVNNAIRYTKEKGEVSIHVYKNEDKNVFEVFNSGSFIAESEINKVFDRLYRGEYARSTPGSGLGLTIAKTIIELHNGEVCVNSEKNKGTTFTIFIKTY